MVFPTIIKFFITFFGIGETSTVWITLSHVFNNSTVKLFTKSILLSVLWLTNVNFYFDDIKGFASSLFTNFEQIGYFCNITIILLVTLVLSIGLVNKKARP
jgi:hypothetical protein